MNKILQKRIDKTVKKRMARSLMSEYVYTFKMRFIFLLLLAITFTPLSLYVLDMGLIDNVRDMLLSTLMCSLFLIYFLYEKDDYAEIEGVFIELKTIKGIIRLNKVIKEI